MSFANFLPVDYEAPKAAGDYMKLQEGENRIRILSSPVIGWEDWTADKKPVRYRFNERPKAPIDPLRPVKHFWAVIVWNYSEARIQILQINQATVRESLETLSKDKDWGAPFFYDVKITKTGEKINTRYSVVALPHRPVSEHIREAFYAKPINLQALFTGEDPFAPCDTPTPGVFDQPAAAREDVDRSTLKRRFDMCPLPFREKIGAFLDKNKLKPDFTDMPDELLDRIEKSINSELELKLVGSA